MSIISQVYEWDNRKDHLNQRKHGVSFEKARLAFEDPNRVIIEDLDHSEIESRYYCFGMVGFDILTVRFTMRGKAIRIFGAANWRKGRKIYEKENF